MKRGTPDHPKMMLLCQRLNLPRYAAVGILECLWHFTARYAPAGDVGKFSDEIIIASLGWTQDASALIQALISCGWLDKSQQVRLMVHDWAEHADDGTDKYLALHRKTYADGRKPRRKLKRSRQVATSRGLPCQPEPEPLPEPVCVSDDAHDAAFQAAKTRPELSALTGEQWLRALQSWAEHPGSAWLRTSEFGEWLASEATLMGAIESPGAWVRSRMGVWLDRVKKIAPGDDVKPWERAPPAGMM